MNLTSTDETHRSLRLLLDTNVFRDLAEHDLDDLKPRLRAIARKARSPVFWICPITLEEIVCHVRADERRKFAHIRRALKWVDELCGDVGFAEDLPWVLRRGTFRAFVPYESELPAAFNSIKRGIIDAREFVRVPSDILEAINKTRDQFFERRKRWIAGRETLYAEVRKAIPPGASTIEGSVLMSNAIVAVARKNHEADIALWGEFRSPRDQIVVQRERIAFELGNLVKAQGLHGYNVHKHANDYNDGWLCAYPAAGYTLVTRDGALHEALAAGGCEEPRVKALSEAIKIAEEWLKADSGGAG